MPTANEVTRDADASHDAGQHSGEGAAAWTGPTTADALEGTAFTKEIASAFRVAACGNDGPLPPNVDPAAVEKHCAALKANYAEYKTEWLDVAGPFIAKIRPAGIPTTVVYPFGGGDLVSALATYPDGTEFTTISLEIAGDIRNVSKADAARISRELPKLRDHLGKLFLKAHSRTDNLGIETQVAIPGEVAFSMAALAIHGFEPVTFRYFSFQPDGSLHWLTDEEITKAERSGKKGRGGPFANAEIRFHRPGDDKVRILRHVAYDLSNDYLAKRPELIKHLDTKSKVSAMTKAATHLLWDDAHFSTIREWLMTHTDWMISDTTGVPPRIARKYGFVQDLYGIYEWPEPFGSPNNKDATEFHELFKGHEALPFRYGYPDNKSHGHMVVTRKPDVGGERR